MDEDLIELWISLQELFSGENLAMLLTLCISITLAVLQRKKVMECRTRKDKFIENAKNNKRVVVAKVVDVGHYTDNDGPGYRRENAVVKYEYKVNGKAYRKTISFHDHLYADYPNTIQIYYAKNNPRNVITSVDWPAYTGKYNPGRRQHALLSSLGVWFVTTGIVFYVLKFLLLFF